MSDRIVTGQHWERDTVSIRGGHLVIEYGPKRLTCSQRCKTRLTVWQNWITRSRREAISGDVNKPAKVAELGSGGLDLAIAPFVETLSDV
jgi:hypothetical protein